MKSEITQNTLQSTESGAKEERRARKEAKRLRKQAEKLVKTTSDTSANFEAKAIPSKAECDDYLKFNSITIHESDDSASPILPIIKFNQLLVPNNLKKILEGFDKPTPIQACSWPALLAGSDVIGIAETGRQVAKSFRISEVLIFIAQWKDLSIRYTRSSTAYLTKIGYYANGEPDIRSSRSTDPRARFTDIRNNGPARSAFRNTKCMRLWGRE